MEVFVQHLGDVKFGATVRGHQIVCDQPHTNGGTDSGMTPPEFLLVSLGTCAGFYAAQYLKTRGLSTEGLAVRVSAEKAAHPARVGSFHIEVTAPGVGSEHEAGLARAAKLCLIHNTLLNTPEIETVVRTGALV